MTSNVEKISLVRELISEAPEQSIVFFGGAGVSTESGIPDYRSSEGLYSRKFKYPPEEMLSRSFFLEHTEDFFDFYFDEMGLGDAKPNQAHKKLTELEEQGKLIAVITQNVDGLHQEAGSRNVLELHGAVSRNSCTDCDFFADSNKMQELRQVAKARDGDGTPRCPACCATVRPNVVLYDEFLDETVLEAAARAVAKASIMIIAGTSLEVYPAAGLLYHFRGSHLIIINRTPTPKDAAADILIQANVGEVFDF